MRVLWRLFLLFRPYWGWMALSVLLALVTMLANTALMATSGWFITAMGLAGVAGVSMNYFTPAAMIRAFAIARTGGRYAERVVSHEATFRLLAQLRGWLYDRLEPLAPAALGGLRSGDVLTRLHADIDQLEQVFLRLFAPAAVALLASLSIVAFVWVYTAELALVLLVMFAGIGIALPVWVEYAGRTTSQRIASARAEFNTALVDTIEGLGELQVSGASEHAVQRLHTIGEDLIDGNRRLARLTGTVQSVIGLAGSLAMAAALVILIPRVTAGTLPAPDLTMFALLAFATFEPLAQVPLAIQTLAGTLASARRIFAFADATPPVPDPKTPEPMPADSTLAFEKVSLQYPGSRQPALQDIDLFLEPGRRVLLVGASGAGKSSIVNLALRFYQPDGGRITLGGVPVEDLRAEDVRCRIAALSQYVHLFTATIADNLRLAKPDATQDELEAACRIAQIHDDIAAQPAGYKTYVGAAGLKLSGGQVRRLAVARALLKDAPVIILDEPTEGMDTLTAKALMQAFLAATRDRAVLVISHRAMAYEDFDDVVVLENGRIVEHGDPERLSTRTLDGAGHFPPLGESISE